MRLTSPTAGSDQSVVPGSRTWRSARLTRPAAEAAAPRGGLLRGAGSRTLGLWLLIVLVVAVCALSIAVGTRSIGLGTVWHALLDGSAPGDETVIVRELRVPRTLLGLLAGLSLGVSGALMQGHTRNPLGDPGLLGVTAGASLAVVLLDLAAGRRLGRRLRLVRLRRGARWPASRST